MILSRVARGYLLVTLEGDARGTRSRRYSYDGGQKAHFGIGPTADRAFDQMVREGSLIPIKGETLFGDDGETAQRYRARTPADG